MVERLSQAYLASGGDLPTRLSRAGRLARGMGAAAAKFKTPWDWSVSALRARRRGPSCRRRPPALMNQLGQPIWRPGSPAGWDDIAASWAAPDALLRRVEVGAAHRRSAGRRVDARALAESCCRAR